MAQYYLLIALQGDLKDGLNQNQKDVLASKFPVALGENMFPQDLVSIFPNKRLQIRPRRDGNAIIAEAEFKDEPKDTDVVSILEQVLGDEGAAALGVAKGELAEKLMTNLHFEIWGTGEGGEASHAQCLAYLDAHWDEWNEVI